MKFTPFMYSLWRWSNYTICWLLQRTARAPTKRPVTFSPPFIDISFFLPQSTRERSRNISVLILQMSERALLVVFHTSLAKHWCTVQLANAAAATHSGNEVLNKKWKPIGLIGTSFSVHRKRVKPPVDCLIPKLRCLRGLHCFNCGIMESGMVGLNMWWWWWWHYRDCFFSIGRLCGKLLYIQVANNGS